MGSQDRTLDHYQELMTINATSHVLRAAREIGVFDALLKGQKTLEQLSEVTQIPLDRLRPLCEALIGVGIIESYEDDFALSSTARLLCQYDQDLGDQTWQSLVAALQSRPQDVSDSAMLPRERFDAIAATQWVHTPAAMQAAEILGTNEQCDEDSQGERWRLLDLGCGSAVWSCAIAYRDPMIVTTAVDSEAALVSARSTAKSIQVDDRFEAVAGECLQVPLAENHYDLAMMAQRLHSYTPPQIANLLGRLHAALKSGGKVIIIDSFRGPQRTTLAESLEMLRLQIQTPGGEVPPLDVAQRRVADAGFVDVQFTYLAASRLGLGMLIAVKP